MKKMLSGKQPEWFCCILCAFLRFFFKKKMPRCLGLPLILANFELATLLEHIWVQGPFWVTLATFLSPSFKRWHMHLCSGMPLNESFGPWCVLENLSSCMQHQPVPAFCWPSHTCSALLVHFNLLWSWPSATVAFFFVTHCWIVVVLLLLHFFRDKSDGVSCRICSAPLPLPWQVSTTPHLVVACLWQQCCLCTTPTETLSWCPRCHSKKRPVRRKTAKQGTLTGLTQNFSWLVLSSFTLHDLLNPLNCSTENMLFK